MVQRKVATTRKASRTTKATSAKTGTLKRRRVKPVKDISKKILTGKGMVRF